MQVEPSHARLGLSTQTRCDLVGAASAAKLPIHPTGRHEHRFIAASFAADAAPTSASALSVEPLPNMARHYVRVIHRSWTKYHHVLQRSAAQGLRGLIHSLCMQQDTVCVDSGIQVEPSHARPYAAASACAVGLGVGSPIRRSVLRSVCANGSLRSGMTSIVSCS